MIIFGSEGLKLPIEEVVAKFAKVVFEAFTQHIILLKVPVDLFWMRQLRKWRRNGPTRPSSIVRGS